MPENEKSSFGEWQKEQEFLAREKEKHPELFLRTPLIDDDSLLEQIGIAPDIFGTRPLGYIKLNPDDFIVEEIASDGTLHTVEDAPLLENEKIPELNENIRTTWAEAVKMGLDTIEIVNEISQKLSLDKKFIGFAGIKDKHALTAQLLSFRGIQPEKLRDISASNFFLKNIYTGKGALQIGDLAGNRFTIFIRTREPISEQELLTKLAELEENGFWNFFYIQRFGVPRLISHKLGLLLLQGRFEDTVKSSLLYAGGREIKYFQEFRKSLAPFWGDWGALLKKTEPLAYALRSERKMLYFLENHPKDFIGALNQIPEQIRLWVYAYGSYLFNKKLSGLIQSGEDVAFELPVALGKKAWAEEIYGAYFKNHGISPPFQALKNFPYIQRPEKNIEVLKKFKLYGVRIVPGGFLIDFFLEKASYATTFLSHLFMLSSGQPIPEGINLDEIDAKEILGTGTIKPLKEGRFRELFEMRKEQNSL
ncbi:MAG: tRNA pseudouridine(13) synthase TruD [Candidatus Sungbacteria bacterium]|nr:tRNA pseudouridine(13) synthase TruD [Candidatus Sungbacteria bacterium]